MAHTNPHYEIKPSVSGRWTVARGWTVARWDVDWVTATPTLKGAVRSARRHARLHGHGGEIAITLPADVRQARRRANRP